MENKKYGFERTVERELLVSNEELAEQLAATNISASIFIKQLRDPSLAMAIMRCCAGQNLRFPCAATILKAAITVFIKNGLAGTYRGRKDRRDALKKTQQNLDEMGIHIARQKIERIFKAKRWVE